MRSKTKIILSMIILILVLNSSKISSHTYLSKNLEKLHVDSNVRAEGEKNDQEIRQLKEESDGLNQTLLQNKFNETEYASICLNLEKEYKEHERRFWTHLIFIHADNNLESMSLVDLGEMTSPLQSNTADHLHLVVYIDRCQEYTDNKVSAPIVSCPNSGLTNPEIKQESISQNFTGAYIMYRWRLSEELRIQYKKRFVWIILEDLGEVDSNSPSVLSFFISKSLDKFPSVYTALTLWNHGSAWSGFGDDHDNSDGIGMFLGDMYKGIKDGIMQSEKGRPGGGRHKGGHFTFDLLGFDACLMMQFDVLDMMSSLATYVLASEDNEPGHGWNFRSLSPVTKRGSIEDDIELFEIGKVEEYRIATPLEYASRIVYGYSLHYQSYPLTLSLVNTDLFRVFRFNLYNLFTILYKCGGNFISGILRKSIMNSRKIENCDLINLCSCFDFGDMLELLRGYLSKEYSNTLDKSVQELLALTLDSYYNMQIISVNIQEEQQEEYSTRVANKELIWGYSHDKDQKDLYFVNVSGEGKTESRLSGISIYFPDSDNQYYCRNQYTAKTLASRYLKQTNHKWVQIIGDILMNKPGQVCNMESKQSEYYYDYQNNKTVPSIISNHEIMLTTEINREIISSQLLITYPISQNIESNMVPISLILPTKITADGYTQVKFRLEGFEILEGENRSDLTLITDINRSHYTGHFVYYEKKEDLNTERSNFAYLIFTKDLKVLRLMVSTKEGMSERNNEGGYLIPILYYIRIDMRKNGYFDLIYREIQRLYLSFSEHINSLVFPLIGINVLPKYEDASIKSKRMYLVTSLQEKKMFAWKGTSGDIKLVSNLYSNQNSTDERRLLVNRYSISSLGSDNLEIIGVKIEKNSGGSDDNESGDGDLSNTSNSDHPIKRGIRISKCKKEWLNDGICDLFCEDDSVDCKNILKERKELDDIEWSKVYEGIGRIEKKYPKYIESVSIHVKCDDSQGRTCWRNSRCIKSRIKAEIKNSDSMKSEGNDGISNYCVCQEGFQHQVIKLIDSKSGKVYFRHSCEDVDECKEYERQYKMEELEQRRGDIYMGYNVNNAIYPTIERRREVTRLLNSPFSSLKKHLLTPSGLKRPCHPLAICLNNLGGYDCVCKKGYYGDGKKTCIQENICLGSSFFSEEEYCPKGLHCLTGKESGVSSKDPKSEKGVKLEEQQSKMELEEQELQEKKENYKNYCGCRKGFKLSSIGDLRCVDIDECTEERKGSLLNGCGKNSKCTNTVGSYICSCPAGWLGDGNFCLPSEERKREIAFKVGLSGFFERLVPMGYQNFQDLFKKSVVETLKVSKERIVMIGMNIDQDKGVMEVIFHIKENLKSTLTLQGREENLNIDLAIKLKKELSDNNSNWYRKTYIGIYFGDMVDQNNIKIEKVAIRGERVKGDKKRKLFAKVINSLITSDEIYIFLNSSPYKNTIIILTLIAILIWIPLLTLSAILLVIKVISKYCK
ncbi:calcium binding EGF domain-containing protein [Cryptosporidium felis]|nr:calcium binding EGF domain-containing protein [Cryptosporidium felis]